jgi:hypothetical protein
MTLDRIFIRPRSITSRGHTNMITYKTTIAGRFGVSAAVLAVFLNAAPSLAVPTIENTVTATATAPGGATITVTDTENVDVVDDTPSVSVVKTAFFAPGGDVDGDGRADAGDTISYSFVVTNTGNVTLKDVKVTDTDDAVGPNPTVATPTLVTTDSGTVPPAQLAAAGQLNDSSDAGTPDSDWDVLGPQDVVTFTATYSVLPADIAGAGGGDNEIDDVATVTGNYNPGTGNITVTGTSSAATVLDTQSALTITKVANDTTDVVAGQVVTYTYTVTNTGNVPLTAIALSDTHNGVLNALTPAFQSFTTNTGSTNSGNTITLLQPGDVAVFTAPYTVKQIDIDTRQ